MNCCIVYYNHNTQYSSSDNLSGCSPAIILLYIKPSGDLINDTIKNYIKYKSYKIMKIPRDSNFLI